MKKPNPPQKHTPKHAKKAVEPDIAPDEETLADTSLGEENIAEDQFAVAGREDEASSSGHRVEPIINDEEGNAEKLIEEGLHGYLHVSKKDRP
jgi:hypothetical protein